MGKWDAEGRRKGCGGGWWLMVGGWWLVVGGWYGGCGTYVMNL